MDKNTQFFIHINGNEAGPFTLANIMQQGITPDTLVWFQGQPNWTKASDIPELNELLKQAPAVAPAQATQATEPIDAASLQVIQDLQARLTELEKKLAEKEHVEACAPVPVTPQPHEERAPQPPEPEQQHEPVKPNVTKPQKSDNNGCNVFLILFIAITALVLITISIHNCDTNKAYDHGTPDTTAVYEDIPTEQVGTEAAVANEAAYEEKEAAYEEKEAEVKPADEYESNEYYNYEEAAK